MVGCGLKVSILHTCFSWLHPIFWFVQPASIVDLLVYESHYFSRVWVYHHPEEAPVSAWWLTSRVTWQATKFLTISDMSKHTKLTFLPTKPWDGWWMQVSPGQCCKWVGFRSPSLNKNTSSQVVSPCFPGRVLHFSIRIPSKHLRFGVIPNIFLGSKQLCPVSFCI